MRGFAAGLLPLSVVSTRLQLGHPNNASKRALGRYDFAGVKRCPGASIVWMERFLKKNGCFGTPGRQKKSMKKRTKLSHAHSIMANV